MDLSKMSVDDLIAAAKGLARFYGSVIRCDAVDELARRLSETEAEVAAARASLAAAEAEVQQWRDWVVAARNAGIEVDLCSVAQHPNGGRDE